MKAKSESTINKIVLHILFGITGSITVGFIVFQSEIFNLQTFSFQFISFGIVCAVYYSACKYFPPKIYIAVLLVLFSINSTISGSLITMTVIRDILFICGIAFTIHLYLNIIKQKQIALPFGNFGSVKFFL